MLPVYARYQQPSIRLRLQLNPCLVPFWGSYICWKRTTGPLPLPFSIMIFHTRIVIGWSGSSGIYNLGQGALSTNDLQDLFTPFRLSLMKGKAHKGSLIIISKTSLFRNCWSCESSVPWTPPAKRHQNHVTRLPQHRQQHQHQHH